MQYSIPEGHQPQNDETVYSILKKRCLEYPLSPLIEYKVCDESLAKINLILDKPKSKIGEFESINAIDFEKIVKLVAKGLLKLGVKKGDAIAISSHTRLEWMLLDFAILMIGCVTIPIYETSSKEQIEHILKDSKAKYAFVENEEIYTNMEIACFDIKFKIKNCFIIEKEAIAGLIFKGKSVSDAELLKRISAVKSTDDASIVYTSGSTGTPKGAVISHRAYVAIAYNSGKALPEVLYAKDAKLLLFLPLAHGFARLVAIAMIASNMCILGLSPNIKELLADLQVFKPTVLLGVPRIFEKVYNAASHKAGNGISGFLFARAAKRAIEWSKSLDQSKSTLLENMEKFSYDPIVYRKIRHVLGGKVQACVCGGAPLNSDIAHFFRGSGINILEGYGMTETVAPVTVNRVNANKIGTIGLPLPGVILKIAQDGELLINAVSNFSKYHNLPKVTKETLVKEIGETVATSGKTDFPNSTWIKSGDLAEIDDEGFIKIVGRKKDLIVTAGGKNISPSALESTIDAHELVGNSVVVGDKMPYVSAIITLDTDGLNNWAYRNGIKNLTVEDAINNQEVICEIQNAIDKANLSVSRAESIRKFRIINAQFTEDEGTLTPSMKIRRNEIMQKYSSEIKKIYSK